MEQLAVAVWRAAVDDRGARSARRSSMSGRRSRSSTRACVDLTLNFASADQGIYTRTPDADGLTANVDGS